MRLMQQCNEFSGFILTRRFALDGEAVLGLVQVCPRKCPVQYPLAQRIGKSLGAAEDIGSHCRLNAVSAADSGTVRNGTEPVERHAPTRIASWRTRHIPTRVEQFNRRPGDFRQLGKLLPGEL